MLVGLFGLFLFQYHQFCSGWLSTLYNFSKKKMFFFMFCYNKVSEMHYISFFSMLENTNMYFSVVGELKYYESEIFHALQLKS